MIRCHAAFRNLLLNRLDPLRSLSVPPAMCCRVAPTRHLYYGFICPVYTRMKYE